MRSYEMTEIVHRGLDDLPHRGLRDRHRRLRRRLPLRRHRRLRPRARPGHRHPRARWPVLAPAARRRPADLPRAARRRRRRRRGRPALRPRGHHGRAREPRGPGGAVRHRPPAPGRPRRHPVGPEPARSWTVGCPGRTDPRDDNLRKEVFAKKSLRLYGRVMPVPLTPPDRPRRGASTRERRRLPRRHAPGCARSPTRLRVRLLGLLRTYGPSTATAWRPGSGSRAGSRAITCASSRRRASWSRTSSAETGGNAGGRPPPHDVVRPRRPGRPRGARPGRGLPAGGRGLLHRGRCPRSSTAQRPSATRWARTGTTPGP